MTPRRILLWYLDGKLANLALMRLAAHHRALSDQVVLRRVSNTDALDAAGYRELAVWLRARPDLGAG